MSKTFELAVSPHDHITVLVSEVVVVSAISCEDSCCVFYVKLRNMPNEKLPCRLSLPEESQGKSAASFEYQRDVLETRRQLDLTRRALIRAMNTP